MAVTINNWNETPPGQWRYRVPETGQWIQPFWAFNDLESAIVAYYKANSLTAPANLRQLVADQLCAQMPPGICHDSSRLVQAGVDLAAEFQRVIQGTTTLVDWWVRGNRQRVTVEESARRAAICAKCIFNQDPRGCTGCNIKALTTIADTIVGGDVQPWDGALRSCLICGCNLHAKVRLPTETLRRHMKPSQLAQLPPAHNGFDGCWLREEE